MFKCISRFLDKRIKRKHNAQMITTQSKEEGSTKSPVDVNEVARLIEEYNKIRSEFDGCKIDFDNDVQIGDLQYSIYHKYIINGQYMYPSLTIRLRDDVGEMVIFNNDYDWFLPEWTKVIEHGLDKIREELEEMKSLLELRRLEENKEKEELKAMVQTHFENKYEHLLVADEN